MPEVAETALTAEILNKYLKNKKLDKLDFVSGRYTRHKAKGYAEFKKALPLTVNKVDSKGKFIWLELTSPKTKQKWYILNTLGMTGMWSLTEPPRPRAILTLDKTKHAYFMDDRNFGTLTFTSNAADLDHKLSQLGPDFLKDDNVDLTPIQSSAKPIYELLMDQKKIGSGLGNYLVTEILYRAGISPHRPGNKITNKELTTLDHWIKDLVKLSYIDNHSKYMANLSKQAAGLKKKDYHPKTKPKEKTLTFMVYRQKVDPHGNKVKVDRLMGEGRAGRSVYWVPKLQK